MDLFPDKLIWTLELSADAITEKFGLMPLQPKQVVALFLNFFTEPPVSSIDTRKSLKLYWGQLL